jgi:hypothetical protein
MRFQIPISTLFTQVFGIAAPLIRKYKVTQDESNSALAKYNVHFEPAERDHDSVDTILGTIHQFPMEFVAGNYNVMNNGIIENISVDGMRLPYTSVASFSRAKRFTETYMSGYKGSVIEQYGWEPWHIRIQGFIIKENDYKLQSIADQVKEMQKYEELCDAIKVKGKVFEWLKIHQVAIVSINYPDARDLDMSVVKPYEMILKSVEPIELILL